jgi:hypothetical protein
MRHRDAPARAIVCGAHLRARKFSLHLCLVGVRSLGTRESGAPAQAARKWPTRGARAAPGAGASLDGLIALDLGDRVTAAGLRLPHMRLAVGVVPALAVYRHLVGHEESRVETHPELPDQVGLFIVA